MPKANSPSFVPGTPSSPLVTPSKRSRQRSSSPVPTSPQLGLAPRTDGHARAKVTIKQYLAIESDLPITGDIGRGILAESAEREAGYLVDEGSQLARDQLCVAGNEVGNGVRWRTVDVRERTIQGMPVRCLAAVNAKRFRSVDPRSIMDISTSPTQVTSRRSASCSFGRGNHRQGTSLHSVASVITDRVAANFRTAGMA